MKMRPRLSAFTLTLAPLLAPLLLAGWHGQAAAQSLPQLLEAALPLDPAAASARAQRLIAQQRLEQQQAARRPRVSLDASVSDARYRDREPGGDSRSFLTRQASVQLSQPLWRTALAPAIDAAQALVEQAAAGEQQTQTDLMLRLVESSFEAMKARDAVVLAKSQRVASQEQLSSAKRRSELGTAPITDLREAEARLDLVSAQLNALEQEVIVRQEILTELTGLQVNGLMQRGLQGQQLPELAAAGVTAWVADAYNGSQAMVQAQRAVDAARADLQRVQQAHMPTVDLVGSLQRYSDTGSASTPLTRRGDMAQIGINLNMPLYTGGAVQAQVEEARASVERAQQEVGKARRQISLQVRRAYSDVLSAVGQARGLEAALRSAELAYRANQRGYELGVKVTADVLDAQSRLFEVRRELSRARYDAWIAHARLKATAGKLQPADFQTLDTLLQAMPAA